MPLGSRVDRDCVANPFSAGASLPLGCRNVPLPGGCQHECRLAIRKGIDNPGAPAELTQDLPKAYAPVRRGMADFKSLLDEETVCRYPLIASDVQPQ